MSRAAVLFVAVLGAACSSPAAPPKNPQPQPVTLARVQWATVPASFEAGGVVHAKSTAAIASRILAPVLDVRVRAGARVAIGDTLVTLDSRDLLVQKARTDAAATAARQSLLAAAAERDGADAALRLASASFARVDRLYSKGVAAGSEFDEATATVDGAKARVTAAGAHTSEATAAVAAAEEASRAAAISASYAVITSPFSGTVTERLIDPGAMAVPGAALLTVEDTSLYRLEITVDEARAHTVMVGQTARVAIGADAWMDARISEIAGLDPARHSFVVKIDLPPAPAVKSGLFGRARLPAGTSRVLSVPASALVRRGQMTFVFVVDTRSVAHLRPVTAALAADGRLEILAGVDEGDMVVDHPPPMLTDGQSVSSGAGP